MVTRWRGRAAVARLVVFRPWFCLAGCTGSSGQPSSAGSPAATERIAALPTPAARVCKGAEIKAGISHFFGAWNHRNASALGRLFTADGVLDMATKHQDTLHRHEWTGVGGLRPRRLIAAFAERQWRLGEKLSHRDTSTVARPNGGPDGGGGVVVARFADGSVQRMVETKFVYDCARQGFAHVVIIVQHPGNGED